METSTTKHQREVARHLQGHKFPALNHMEIGLKTKPAKGAGKHVHMTDKTESATMLNHTIDEQHSNRTGDRSSNSQLAATTNYSTRTNMKGPNLREAHMDTTKVEMVKKRGHIGQQEDTQLRQMHNHERPQKSGHG